MKNSLQIASWLNDCTDEEFVEVFTAWEKLRKKESIDQGLTSSDIFRANPGNIADTIRDILCETIPADSDIDESAWWKEQVRHMDLPGRLHIVEKEDSGSCITYYLDGDKFIEKELLGEETEDSVAVQIILDVPVSDGTPDLSKSETFLLPYIQESSGVMSSADEKIITLPLDVKDAIIKKAEKFA